MTEARPFTPTRRQVLRGGATVAGVGAAVALSASALTACGGSSAPQAEGPRTLAQPVQLPKSEVPVGGGVVKVDAKIVVTQPAAGEFHAFSAVCTHQGCLVSRITATAIICGCHNSQFATTDGSRIAGPARAALPAVQLTADGDTLQIG